MRSNATFDARHVQAVYESVQRQFYELFMGQQIHVGGLGSSVALAEVAGIAAGQSGIELCCGTGAGMRMLVRLFGVASMLGVELATAPVDIGRRRVEADGLSERIRFVIGDATATDLPDEQADFVWGEDAWCYVADKAALITEASRLLRAGGTIAFTDWVEGAEGLSDEEADHVMQIMTFPSLQTIDGYRSLLEGSGFEVFASEDTTRFGPSFALYAEMLRSQFGFDALELFEFDRGVLDVVVEQLLGLSALGNTGKLVQARFVARKTETDPGRS
jgi:ubiquinone/menaquinone biosynthesis C-methylase UbiE